MAREIRKGDRIVGLGAVLTAVDVDGVGVMWNTGVHERHEDIAVSACHWRHEDGEEIAPLVNSCGEYETMRRDALKLIGGGVVFVAPVDECWTHIGYSGRPVAATPRTDTMALAIFRTDPDVLSFCGRVGERHTVERSGGDTTLRINETAYQRALNIAWERDENGWRTRAIARADAVIAEMCR